MKNTGRLSCVLVALAFLATACSGMEPTNPSTPTPSVAAAPKAPTGTIPPVPTPTPHAPVSTNVGTALTAKSSLVGELPRGPSDSQAVFVSDGLAFVAGRDGLSILDVTDPTAPVQVGSLTSLGWSSDVFISGRPAFVVGSGGLRVVDVADPSAPLEVGTLEVFDANRVFISGDLAFVTGGSLEGLLDVDVSHPATLMRVGSLDIGDSGQHVAVSGGLAFVATASGLSIVDVGDPSTPLEVGFLDIEDGIGGVFVSGDWAYLRGSRVTVVDVSDPSNPVGAGYLGPWGQALDAFVTGDLAFLANAGAGLLILNVSDPRVPVEVGWLSIPGYSMSVSASGDLAYIGSFDPDTGLSAFRVLDISDPNRPAVVGSVSIPGRPGAVAIQGSLAFVTISFLDAADEVFSQVRIVDLTDPIAPMEIGILSSEEGIPAGLFAAGGLAYVADERGLHILDPGVATAVATLTVDAEPAPSQPAAETAITFLDPKLELSVRTAIGAFGLGEEITAKQAAGITTLMLSPGTIDLNGIERFTNLTGLAFSSAQVGDLSPLAALTKLTALSLSETGVTNLSPLANLTKLTWLDLSKTGVSDLSSIAGLTNLTVLNLTGNQISDISPLLLNRGPGAGDQVSLQKNDLKILDFYPAGTTDSEVIKTLSSRGVGVSFDSVSDGSAMPDLILTRAVRTALSQGLGELTSAAELAGITDLRVSERETVRNLTGLELLVNLKQLTLLSVGSLHDLAPLAGLTQLTSLRLERDAYTATTPLDLAAVADLTNLTELNLRWNMVEDIAPLANLTKLTSLNLPRNELVDISSLANLTNLTALDLRDNQITDISPLLANRGIGAGVGASGQEALLHLAARNSDGNPDSPQVVVFLTSIIDVIEGL